MDWLRQRGGRHAKRLDVEGELTIGRGQPGLGAIADDEEMSRRHARFTHDASGYLIVEDLGSSNGTFVNDRQISRATELRPGDVVRIGATELEVIGDRETRIRRTPTVPEPGATRIVQKPPPRPRAEPRPSAEPRPTQPTAPRQAPPPPPPPPSARPAPAPPPPPPPPSPAQAPVASTPFSAATPPAARRRDPRVAVLAVALVLALGGLVASLALGGGSDDSAAASAEPPYDGTVYALTNRVQPNQNSVVAIRYGANGFEPLRMREYPTGGSGSTLVGDNRRNSPVAVDGDQQLQVDRERKLLFAVNQGSDSIAVFRIAEDGGLTAVEGSPFASGGTGPISIGLSEDTVIVVNKGLDGQRKINDPGTIAQFQLSDGGRLTPIGQPRRLSPRGGAAQAFVIDRADLVVVPELVGGPYHTMLRGAQGTFRAGPTTRVTDRQRALGVPLREALVAIAPPGTEIPERLPPAPQGAQGLSVHPEQDVVYSQLPPFSLLMVHTFDRSGNLRFVRGTKIAGGLLACWSRVSPDGNTLYVSVAGTHTVAVFDLRDPRKPLQIQSLRLGGLGGHTFNLELDPSGKRLFVIDSWEPTFDMPGFGNQVHMLEIGQGGRLSIPKRGSLARLPVLNGTSSYGLAVVPRRSLASKET